MPAVTRCLGCAFAISDKDHRCAKNKPLLPYGGFCGCPIPGCGPSIRPTPQACKE